MRKSIVISGEMESIRATLLELDAIEEPTEEQVTQARTSLDTYTALEDELKDAVAHEEKMDRVRAHAISHPEARERGSSPDVFVPQRRDPFADLDQVRAGYIRPNDLRARAMDAIESLRSEFFTDAQRERATHLARDPKIAQHILMTGSPEYHEDFARFMQDPVGYRGTALTLTDANGGYLVPFTLDPTVILTNDGSDNPFRQISRIETTATDNWNGVTSGGVTAEWLAEATEAAEAGPTFGNIQITPAKAFAEITASYEILQDSNFAAQLPRLIQDAKDRLEATAFATGATAPKGIITAVAAVTTSRVSPTTAGAFTSASAADVYKVITALPPRHRSRSKWVANFATYNIIRQMDTSGGSSFWSNFAGPLNPETLLGLGVYESSAMTATVTTGSNILLAGDFSEYIIVDRVGMSMSYDPNVRSSANMRHTGQGQFTAFWRVGAGVGSVNAFRVLQL
jgi:HK97 family phage major capsid protein